MAITAENIINRDFSTANSFEKLFTDITQINTNLGSVFLSAIIDVHNKKVIGAKIMKNQKTELVLHSLIKLLKHKKDFSKNIILHTDRGSQYTSEAYTNALKKAKITHSMSRPGKCPDNSPIETFWGVLKSELIYINRKLKFDTFEEIEKYILDYIEFYNNVRISKNNKKIS